MAGKPGMKIKKANEDSPKHAEYYKKLNPSWNDEQCKEAALHFKRSSNWQCIEYYEKLYPNLTHEEHLKLKEERQNKKANNCKTKLNYWVNNYPELTLEEQKELCSKYNKEHNYQCIEYYLSRGIPEDEAEKIMKSKIKGAAKKISEKVKGDKNPMHHSRTTQEQRNAISPRNIAFYENKYPDLSHEEHVRLRDKFFEENRQRVKNAIKDKNIEYYLNQGMLLEEAKIALKERQSTFSLKKCIERYGVEEGTYIFEERQSKWVHKLQKNFEKYGDGRGGQSQFGHDLISVLCEHLNIEYPKKEKYIGIKGSKDIKGYAYDFCYGKKLIEFNGDYWHCNPKIYNGDFYHKTTKRTAAEIWAKDKHKKELAEHYGYKLLTIWESDYNEDREAQIKKCIDFLNE